VARQRDGTPAVDDCWRRGSSKTCGQNPSYASWSNVVLIDNVAEYYYSHHVDAKRGPDGPEQFPQLAPPFPMAFYEYTLPPWMYDTLFTDAENGAPRALNQVGVLVTAVETSDIHVNPSEHSPLSSVLSECKIGLARQKW